MIFASVAGPIGLGSALVGLIVAGGSGDNILWLVVGGILVIGGLALWWTAG